MSSLVVETRYGLVEGTREGKVCVWRGIPYAAPPVGPLRFRAPQEPIPWKGIRPAVHFAPAAVQRERETMKFLNDCPSYKSEDCLYLNVWSPGADGGKRPVMVWIHGGSFAFGSGSSPMYDGASFAEKGDVVVVTVNYRLGVFGFLDLSAYGGEDYADSGNCGMLDQVAALRWVRENIEAFGGDPDNVTIFGESAGSVSVSALLAMPAARGLFRKAIMQSGTAKHTRTRDAAAKVTVQYLDALGVRPGELFRLHRLSADEMLKATEVFQARVWGPVRDGRILPENPEGAIREGAAKGIPVLIGNNRDEWRWFTHFDSWWQELKDERLHEAFELSFGDRWPALSAGVLRERSLDRDLYHDMMTFEVFTYPSIALSEFQVQHGTPVWMYRFDYPSPTLDGHPRAYHALEIPFVWNTLGKEGMERITGSGPERFSLAEKMHRAWIAFAHRGDPNVPELPEWPRYDLQRRATMIFDREPRVADDPDGRWREIWTAAARRVSY